MYKVFVYGSLLSGMGNHRLLANSKKLGVCNSPLGFGMIDLGAFPGAIKVDDPDAKIIGEVYEISGETLKRLNHLEGYRPSNPEYGLYNRIEIDTEFGKAFIYIYNCRYPHRNDRLVKDGDWKSCYTNKLIG